MSFWQTKTLTEMSRTEWESLCDGCGLCCMVRLEDEDTGEIALTRLSCRYLDIASCRCTDYANRSSNVPGCTTLQPHLVKEFTWLPESCAYRLIDEGKPLHDWHPLISGNKESVHEAGISKRSVMISEEGIAEEEWEDYII
jgi:uncharacterized cysteine cluster protein YcgN (CxxCxxCC family)